MLKFGHAHLQETGNPVVYNQILTTHGIAYKDLMQLRFLTSAPRNYGHGISNSRVLFVGIFF